MEHAVNAEPALARDTEPGPPEEPATDAADTDAVAAEAGGPQDPAESGDLGGSGDSGGSAAGRDAEAAGAGETTADETAETGAGAAEEGATGAEEGAAGAEGTTPAAEEPASGTEGPTSGTEESASGAEASTPGAELSEAEAELQAQRELRARIERRKAEKQSAPEAGTKLSGKAADLLAAVRAVESGERPADSVFAEPAAPRRAAAPPSPGPRTRPAPRTLEGPAPEVVEAVAAVLGEGGAPAALAAPTAVTLGPEAPELLRADPWQLLQVPGVRPDHADGFARALLGGDSSPADERRGRALTTWLLAQAAAAGHTALEAPQLTEALARQSVPDPEAAVQSAIAEGDILVFQDALDQGPSGSPGPAGGSASAAGGSASPAEAPEGEQGPPVRVLLGLERHALAEESLADGVARLAASPTEGPADGSWEDAAARLGGSAAELVRAVAGHCLALHTGGETAHREPAALLALARASGLRVCAAAHTPYGARQFAALLERAESGGAKPGDAAADTSTESGSADFTEAVTTVSALLRGAAGPARDGEGALAVDLLVVLDAPQLDVETAASLVEALPDGARLVLSGDPAVLWSAGPGRVFADLLAARRCPHIASRTPDPGPLGELTSGIGAGELLQVEAPDKEVVIVPVREPAEAVHRTVQLVADSVPRTFGVPAGETQVITVGHGGPAGTQALNAALKERLNPGPGRFGGFDPGDRVVHTPAPGLAVPGVVAGAEAEGLRLDCEGGTVVVPKDRVGPEVVRHGWAITAHQAVGRRWPTVVVVLPGDAAGALTRSWVYTAFGRGERHLSVVHGVEAALPRAVAERPVKPRTSRLETLLRAPQEAPAPPPSRDEPTS
ncbi:ATP-binding domain-containing protein [Streptomyces sp. LD120]|uniref:ATP-binding domain-containing protein n=1 Tax=Streptomyces physcomitrii TaxID=2724184 RepID=A0ABX1H850_9ACTN|nr:ATP-binding domain-containing protein [Streptomyces physcomitrii]